MRNERYSSYLQSRDDSSPEGRYTERLAQDGMSPLAKLGVGAGVLGLAVLGLRTRTGQKALSAFGRGITNTQQLSNLESNMHDKYYFSKNLLGNLVGNARKTGQNSMQVRDTFRAHQGQMIEALKRRHEVKNTSTFNLFGLRSMTVGDVLDRRTSHTFGQVDRIYDKRGSHDAGKDWLETQFRAMTDKDPSLRNLSMGKGMFISRTGETVDLRGLYQKGGAVLDFAKDLQIPVVQFNPYSIARIGEMRERATQPLFEVFHKGSAHIAIGDKENQWKISETLVKYGNKLHSLTDPSANPLPGTFYSYGSSKNLLARMYTGMAGRTLRQDKEGYIPGFLGRVYSKYVDDSKYQIQAETFRQGYTTATKTEDLHRVHTIFSQHINRNIDPLSDNIYGLIEDRVSNIYGRSMDMSKEGIFNTFESVVHERTGVKNSLVYRDQLKGMWTQLQRNPQAFMDSSGEKRVRILLQKEFIRKAEAADPSFNMLNLIEDNSTRIPFLSKSSKNAKAFMLSQVLDNTEPSDIARLMVESSAAGDTYRSLSREVVNNISPIWDISSGLVGRYPSRDLIEATQGRILVRGAVSPKDGMGDFLKQFVAGAKSPEHITTATALPYYTGLRLNEMLSSVGVGLNPKDMASVGSTYLNLFTKRYIPAVVGLAGLNYISYEVGNLTGRSLKERGADALAVMQMDYARATDASGLTKRFQELTRVTPGLHESIRGLPGGTFFDPSMTAEDTEEWLRYGDEARRRGRWWPLGNTAYIGGRTEFYEPSWYRRVHAQPLMTDVMYGSEQEYWENHWLPTPRNPAAPIRHFITDPYHYEEKHYDTRPYPQTGGFSEIEDIPIIGPTVGRAISAIFKPTVKMHEEVWTANETRKIDDQTRVYALGGSGVYSSDEWGPARIGAGRARDLSDSKRPSVVAVLDTGVDSNHPDLKGRVYQGINTVDWNRDTSDPDGHGTHVAGTIAARSRDGRGITGVADDVRILPVKVLGKYGGTATSVNDGIAYAIDWVGPDGETVDVINMSLGSDARVDLPYRGMLIQEAREKGISVVSASGNSDLDRVGWPARWADGIAVGATDKHDRRASFSNYGPGLDLMAPGTDIKSTWIKEGLLERRPYRSIQGTSMSSPHVAGAVAFLKSELPDLTPDELRYLLKRTAKDLGEEGYDEEFGHGLIQLDKALEKAISINREELSEKAKRVGERISVEREQQLNESFDYLMELIGKQGYSGFTDEYENRIQNPNELGLRTRDLYRQASTLAGLYGYMIDSQLTDHYSRIDQELVLADSRAMTSPRRQFWESGINGLSFNSATIDANEVLRRFVGKSDNLQRRYNPIPNQMPDWIPGDEYFTNFQVGDPYIKVTRGEQRLPGAGYESLWDLNPDELGEYGKLDRMRILGDIAPYSDQYKKYSKMVTQDPNMTPEQLAQARKIREQVSEKKNRLRLYPYVFKTADIEKESVTVTEVLNNSTFLTKEYPDNPVRLAGVYAHLDKPEEAREFLSQYIHPGAELTIGYTADDLRKFERDTHRTLRSVVYHTDKSGAGRKQVTNINKELIDRGYARERENDNAPAGVHARFTPEEITMGKTWETGAHMDTIFNTKFLQVRSPLESYKRRDVFGKDWQPWSVKDVALPTLESMYANNTLKAATMGAGLAFAMYSPNRLKGALVGAGVGAAFSIIRQLNEAVKGERWIPKRRREERKIDEYFDVLQYVKYKGLYEQTRQKIREEQGFDVEYMLRGRMDEFLKDNISAEEAISNLNEQTKKASKSSRDKVSPAKREVSDLNRIIKEARRSKKADTPKSNPLREINEDIKLAAQRRNEYHSTLHGIEFAEKGWYRRVFSALPRKDREYFPHFVNATPDERREILELVPDNQKRIYQRLWQQEENKRPDLEKFFKDKYLPEHDWEGWRESHDLTDVKVKVIKQEGLDLSEFGLWRQDELKAEYNNAPRINIDDANHSGGDLTRKLEAILSGKGLSDVSVTIRRSSSPGVHIEADIEKDRQREIEEYIEANGLEAIF